MNVFISHSAADREFAKRLASELSGRGFSAWNEDQILPGDNWARELGNALDRSDAMVVLISPDSVESPRLARDVEYALGARRYEGRLIGLVIRPTEQIPWILEHLQALLKSDNPTIAGREVAGLLARKREVAGR